MCSVRKIEVVLRHGQKLRIVPAERPIVYKRRKLGPAHATVCGFEDTADTSGISCRGIYHPNIGERRIGDGGLGGLSERNGPS